jgi:hypothetical protein
MLEGVNLPLSTALIACLAILVILASSAWFQFLRSLSAFVGTFTSKLTADF